MQQRRMLPETSGRRHDHSRGKGVPSSASVVPPGNVPVQAFRSTSDSQDPAKFAVHCLRLASNAKNCVSYVAVHSWCDAVCSWYHFDDCALIAILLESTTTPRVLLESQKSPRQTMISSPHQLALFSAVCGRSSWAGENPLPCPFSRQPTNATALQMPTRVQGCGEQMRADKRRRHHATACPMRYLPCPLGCPKKVRSESDRPGGCRVRSVVTAVYFKKLGTRYGSRM